jgi:hypothetical protein
MKELVARESAKFRSNAASLGVNRSPGTRSGEFFSDAFPSTVTARSGCRTELSFRVTRESRLGSEALTAEAKQTRSTQPTAQNSTLIRPSRNRKTPLDGFLFGSFSGFHRGKQSQPSGDPFKSASFAFPQGLSNRRALPHLQGDNSKREQHRERLIFCWQSCRCFYSLGYPRTLSFSSQCQYRQDKVIDTRSVYQSQSGHMVPLE